MKLNADTPQCSDWPLSSAAACSLPVTAPSCLWISCVCMLWISSSLLVCLQLDLHGSVLTRCSVINPHCAPLFSHLSSFFLFHSLFLVFMFFLLLTLSVHFSFPYLGFQLLSYLLLLIIICIHHFLSFLPSSFLPLLFLSFLLSVCY